MGPAGSDGHRHRRRLRLMIYLLAAPSASPREKAGAVPGISVVHGGEDVQRPHGLRALLTRFRVIPIAFLPQAGVQSF